jgi:hypothetical protein
MLHNEGLHSSLVWLRTVCEAFSQSARAGLMDDDDIISMPDKWEYPWYAAWDLAIAINVDIVVYVDVSIDIGVSVDIGLRAATVVATTATLGQKCRS